MKLTFALSNQSQEKIMKQLLLLSFIFLSVTTAFSQAANNTICTATALTPSTYCINVAGNLKNANSAAPAGACGGATNGTTFDVWYKFTAPTTPVKIILSGLGSSLTAATTYIQVINSSDGTCGGTLGSSFCQAASTSLNATGLTAGNSYWVRVYVTVNPNVGATTPPYDFNICLTSQPAPTRMNEVFSDTIIANNAAGINSPWEITYEPKEDSLWITENTTYKIRKMAPNGNSRVILDLSETGSFATFRRTFNSSQNPWPQGGMMGFAIHPQFLAATSPQNYVYVAYVRAFVGPGPAGGVRQTATNPSSGEAVKGDLFTTFLVRFTYDAINKTLGSPVALCDTLTGSNDHNSGRIIIAPVGGTDYLFYALGDMGAGQFYSAERTNKAQMTNSYEGKILRFNLDNTGTGTGLDKWIPDDNPFNSVAPVTGKSAVWSIGIRNNQGFAYVNNTLFGSSHGPFSDDEVNVIVSGKNYGHPRAIGIKSDGNYNNARAATVNFKGWSNEFSASPLICSLPLITNEATDVISNYQDPIYSFFQSDNPTIVNLYTTNPSNSGWPSIAPSGMGGYTDTKIPGWKNSLLLASLKRGYILRIKPNAAGTGVDPIGGLDTSSVLNTQNRFRDIAFGPDGWTIYAVVDRSGQTSGPTSTTPVNSVCPGCVIKYKFLGYNPTGTTPFPSTIPTSIPVDSSTSAGCVTATAVTINPANKNTNLWVPITGPNGNIIAEINANNNDLGNITTSFFTRTGAPVRTAFANKYLNRNVTISVQNNPPATPVSVRLYITAKELADMVGTAGSGVTGITDVAIYKNSDACGTAMATVASTAGITFKGRYVQSTYGHAIQFDVTSFSSFYFLSSASTLPFDLLSFTGKAVSDAAKLEWVVNNEQDVISYTIQRSLDNTTFEDIATVDAKKSQAANITYNYTDFNAGKLAPTVYYRIHSNENSGTRKFSNIISINFASLLVTGVTVFPNPVTEKTMVMINAIADETANLKIVDNTGRVIRVMEVNLVKGKNSIQLDLTKFKPGIYFIDVNGKAISEKAKLIKQ
jgi:trimeric autotransporter adhesin